MDSAVGTRSWPWPSARRTSPTSWPASYTPLTSTSPRPQRRERPHAHVGLLNVWCVNFFKAGSRHPAPRPVPAPLPRHLPGSSSLWSPTGSPCAGRHVTTRPARSSGEPGTTASTPSPAHIHQGTQLIPADFIAVQPRAPTKDGEWTSTSCFLSNYLAQTAALAFGRPPTRCVPRAPPRRSSRPARLRRQADHLDPRPALTPAVVGAHRPLRALPPGTSRSWGIDSFDQWGVELGKKLALEIAPPSRRGGPRRAGRLHQHHFIAAASKAVARHLQLVCFHDIPLRRGHRKGNQRR